MRIDQKCTVYGSFIGKQLPRTFDVYNSKGELYYRRSLNGHTPRVKFNILHPDNYTTNVPFEVIKIGNLELPERLPELPPYTRDRVKDVTITYNPNLSGTPAQIDTKNGVIYRSPEFYQLTKPIRVFILLHEVGHFFYGVNADDLQKAKQFRDPAQAKQFLKAKMLQGEIACDTFALIHFLRAGFNRSTAFQALKNVLKRSPENLKRLQALLSNIKDTQNAQLEAA